MRLYIRKENVGKYKIFVIRIGLIKVEFCLFNGKFLWRLEINNWDK